MIRLAHISDIHLGPLPPVRLDDFASKRITGYFDWRFSRNRKQRQVSLDGLADHMKSMRPDLIAVSGDLVNLGAASEFEVAAKWLETLGSHTRVAVTLGNHDAFVSGSQALAEEALGSYMRGQTLGTAPFPFVRRFGDVALISCNSGVPRPLFISSGRFDIEQAKQLTEWLKKLGEMGLFRAVMIHHPPDAEHGGDARIGLVGADLFRHAIAEAGAELVLHGHLHRTLINALPGPKGEVPLIGIAAASADLARGEEPARYNLFEIERAGSGFTCMLTEYGYQRVGEGIVKRLRMRLS